MFFAILLILALFLDKSVPQMFSSTTSANSSDDLSDESQNGGHQQNNQLIIPYVITAVILIIGAISLSILFIYKRYVPPKEEKIPAAFQEQMPSAMSYYDKFLLWKESLPSVFSRNVIAIGSILILFYYGIEVTYFQFVVSFVNNSEVPINGSTAAHIEAALAGKKFKLININFVKDFWKSNS